MSERLPPLGDRSKIITTPSQEVEPASPKIETGEVEQAYPLLPKRAPLAREEVERLSLNLVEALEFASAKKWPAQHGPMIGRLDQALETVRALDAAGALSVPPRVRELVAELSRRTIGILGARADEVRALIEEIGKALPAETLTKKIALAPGGVERTIVGPWGTPVREITHAHVTLADGTKLKARLWLPMNASAESPCPAVVEALPYGSAYGTVKRDWINATRLAGEGVAWARIDLRGSGESTGSMSDEYTEQEQRDIVEAMAALAEQPWCNEKSAIVGNSWGAFNGSQVAGLHPEGLAAIVMSCGSEDRYADDVHYKGGMIVGEQLVYGNSFLVFVGRPPDPTLDAEWKEKWIERMKRFEPPLPVWLSHPDRSDGYWDTPGDPPAKIEVPVLAVGGFADSYSNSVSRVVSANRAAKGIIGPGGHGYPHLSRPAPAFPFLDYAGEFLRQAFGGKRSSLPDLIMFMENGGPPDADAMKLSGRWISIADANQRDEITVEKIDLGKSQVAFPGQGGPGEYAVRSPQNLGHASGKFCPFGVPGQLPSDQRPDDAKSLCFDVPVRGGIELAGAPVVHLKLTSDSPQGNLIVRLNSVGPDGASTRISYGVLNLAHRNGSTKPEPMVPGKEYDVRVQLDDIAYSVPRGHKLRVAISNAYWPMFWPSSDSATLRVKPNGSTLELPRFHGPTVEMPEAVIPKEQKSPTEKVREGSYSTTVTSENGREITTVIDDSGAGRDSTGMVSETINVQTYSIDPNHPLSARAECVWTTSFSRDQWRTSVEGRTTQTSTADHFLVESSLEMKHGDEVVLERRWSHRVPRRNV